VFTGTDNCEGDITPVVTTTGPSITGCAYSQTWNANYTDVCGNVAEQVSITYTWTVDTELPVISTMAASGDLGCNPTVVAPVFTGTDNCEGTIVPAVTTDGPSNTGCAYTQTWNANYTDVCGNVAEQVSITYTWTVDTELPVISTMAASGDLGCNPTVVAPVFTGTDNCEGTIVPAVTTDGPSNTGCAYTQTWNANYTDVCGNVAEQVSITYTWTVDTELPVISTMAASGDLGCNPTVVAPVFTGTDNCEGTIVPAVTTDGPSNTGCAYTQTWNANYTDVCGNVAEQVSITYTWTVDTELPVISTVAVSGDLGCNPTVVAPAFTGTDNCEGDITPVVTTAGPSITGCAYTQTWNANYTDVCGNAADAVSITYTWTVDTELPIITLIGNTTVSLCIDQPYTDAGATALDNCSGDITGNISTNNPVNTGVAGTYTVTYDVMDECGNPAIQVTRTVIVNALPTVTAGAYGPACVDAEDITLEGTPSGGVWTGTGVSGSGPYVFDPSFGTQMLTYTYTDGNECTNSDQTTLTVNVLPMALIITGSAICASPGGNGVITSSTSESGVNYQLYDGLDMPVGMPILGTGSALSWTGLQPGSGYYVNSADANGCTATSNEVDISSTLCIQFNGKLIWSKDLITGVGNGSVELKNAITNLTLDSDLTPASGLYELLVTDYNGDSVIVKPKKNTLVTNGLSSADVLRILQHVSNTNLFTNPFDLVAADVNRSNSVTSQDAALVNGVILGNPLALAVFNVSWRFIPEVHTLPTNPPPAQPLSPVPSGFWSFPEQLGYKNLLVNQTDQDFIGIKLGDVVLANANPALRGVAPFVWKVEDQELQAGTEIQVSFKSYGFTDLAAMQFALSFDTDYLQYASLIALPRMPLNESHFGAFNATGGELRTSWYSENARNVKNGMSVFSIRFKVLKGGARLKEVLHLNKDLILAEAYNLDLIPRAVLLEFTETNSMRDLSMENLLPAADHLMQNEPNPFSSSTMINFDLSRDCEAILSIYDASGRLLWENQAMRKAGSHSVMYRSEEGQAPGILYYTLRTPESILTRKMMLIPQN